MVTTASQTSGAASKNNRPHATHRKRSESCGWFSLPPDTPVRWNLKEERAVSWMAAHTIRPSSVRGTAKRATKSQPFVEDLGAQ